MKSYSQIISFFCLIAGYVFATLSCINHIGDEEDPSSITPGDIPIKVSAKSLYSQIYSKDCNESIGLYVLVEPSGLDKELYIQNARFICTPSGFSASKAIFYPSQKTKCDFISYYPYQEPGISDNQQTLPVKVKADQSTIVNYNTSDFMIACVTGVTPTSKNIELSHEHKLCQLTIIIKPADTTNLKELQNSNPEVIINNVYTETFYNFATKTFLLSGNNQNIIPGGNWNISNGKLIGKKCILIPQIIAATNEIVTLYVGNKSYSCHLSENYELESGKSCELVLNFDPQQGINTITPVINDWKEGSSSEIIPEEKEEKETVSLNDFNFEKSNVFRIFHHGKAVAEICKEYLLADNIQAQAIVIYPIKNGTIELTNGLVMQIIDNIDNTHGGKVSWNEHLNSLDYIAGDQPPITRFYIAPDFSIQTGFPDKPLLVSIQKTVLTDGRGNETNLYPIVKIGTQYWMREDLRTAMYTNGKKITLKTSQTYSKTTAGYFKNNSYYFYNKAAVISGKLAPEGWRVADNTDWEQLISYVRNDASVLKANKNLWKESDAPILNLTGFQSLPIGIFTKSSSSEKSTYSFEKQYIAYWSTGSTPESLSETSIILKYDANDIKRAKYSDYSGYCIRCIRK